MIYKEEESMVAATLCCEKFEQPNFDKQRIKRERVNLCQRSQNMTATTGSTKHLEREV